MNHKVAPQSLLKALVLVLAMVLPFWPTWANLLQEWTRWDQALGHGLLIAAATLYAIFALALTNNRNQPSLAKIYSGITLVLAFAVLAALSQRVAMDAITQLALVGLLLGLLMVFFPEASWLKLLQTSGLLVFALQAWGSLNGILLWLASEIVGSAVSQLSIPALIDGNSITLPFGIMLIADGCSGLRYFVVAIALGWMLSMNLNYKLPAMLLTLTVAVALALIMNWIRIFILILVGYYSEMQSSLVHEHELFGWVLFGAIMLPAMFFAPHGKKQAAS
ncbi:MAG: exosortase/archaeosortase family protein [Saccharospirillum sp.]|nr:exosortase/archaeosortase family protein [Saccharospirillum sp.]